MRQLPFQGNGRSIDEDGVTIALFENSHSILTELSEPGAPVLPPRPRASDSPAPEDQPRRLLLELGYVHVDPASGVLRPDGSAPEVVANRLALLSLASRLERVFTVPGRLAPGAFFVGGEIAPARFGLTPPDDTVMSAGGRGVTLCAAFEGCVGEAAEYLSFVSWGDESIHHARADDLHRKRDLGCSEDVLLWMLNGIGLAAGDANQTIGWLKFRSLEGSKELAVPADLCIRRRREGQGRSLRKAESSGCAAGPTVAHACYHALMELVERDAVALWWYGRQPARPLLLENEREDILQGFVQALRDGVERPYRFLDVTSDLGIPVVVALSYDHGGNGAITGFAADLDPLMAAQDAALEMCQMELALDLVRLKIEQEGHQALNSGDKRHLDRSQRMHVHAFPQFQPHAGAGRAHGGNSEPELEENPLEGCCARLRRAGLAAFWIDVSRSALGIPAVRVVVPGLQSVKPDWVTHRLRCSMSINHQSCLRSDDLPPLV